MAVRSDDVADGERAFVQQLQSRQFFDLAEQFCQRQSDNCRTVDDRAAWQSMLADCREEHAWMLHEPGRTQILTHAVQSITEFVRKESPRAELDLLLRVRQVEILTSIARIDATVSELGPKAAAAPLATQSITEGLQLAEAMLQQIDQIRRQIESSVARTARDRIRYVTAELLLLQARQKSSDTTLRAKAADAAEQLMRSSSDDDMRFRARSLLAESLLDSNDFKGFELSVTSLTSAAGSQAQQISIAALKIRGLLRRGQPSEALQLTLDLETQGLRSEQLSTMRLASLLALFELLHQLDAAELRQKTADEFRLLSRRLIPAVNGVWRDCCTRISLRFSHVDKFGVEAATAIESVGDLIGAGDLAAARNTLLQMKPEFERSNPTIAATLLMQAGDLAIRMTDWQAAETDLSSAIALFQATKNCEQEAASDLLRIYAMGRNWDAADARRDVDSDVLQTAYRMALEQHIATYNLSTTTSKAREWRAMLIRTSDPVEAAEELLTLVDGISDDQPPRLIQAGQILIEAAFQSGPTVPPVDFDRIVTAITDWNGKVEACLARSADSATSKVTANRHRAVFEIQQSIFSLQRRWSANDDWKKLADDTTSRLLQLAAAGATGLAGDAREVTVNDQESFVPEATANGHAILALTACRRLLGVDLLKEYRATLLASSDLDRRRFVTLLLHQASESKDVIPGDPQLGFLALDLLLNNELTAQPVARQLEQLTAILGASKVADNFEQFDSIITVLTARSLTDEQLQATAFLLQRRSELRAGGTSSKDTARTFWQSVLTRSKSGDDQWLEASLQLATIAVQERRIMDAAKVINVIDALHPDWGTPERKARAAAMKAELESSQ
ncbi:MAG: hypothetical protein O2856_02160 [Planctomycetota bacterium]|nr:hypothetical protein [Planctomycetota bacterium]